MFWAKKQEKTSEKEPNIMEISNLPDRDFKVMVINMLTKLRAWWTNLVRTSRKFLKIYYDKSELKNMITEMKNALERTGHQQIGQHKRMNQLNRKRIKKKNKDSLGTSGTSKSSLRRRDRKRQRMYLKK